MEARVLDVSAIQPDASAAALRPGTATVTAKATRAQYTADSHNPRGVRLRLGRMPPH